ncbi:hypothetical protein [Sphingomonas oryzagri]
MSVRFGTISRAALGVSLLALAACGSRHSANDSPANTAIATGTGTGEVASPAIDTGNGAVPTPTDTVIPTPTDRPVSSSPAKLISCAADIGPVAADRLARLCRNVSPATHPPCNVANSCAMMEDEVARSCALFDGKVAPMPGCKPDPKSEDAAVAVVQRYYSALDAHDYDTAWQQWGENGPANQTRDRFAAGFAHTKSTRVTIGALQPGEGGAGSIYQTVPVTVDATLDDGSHQRFVGDYVVRRVNDVDGASPDQLRWHIGSAHMKAAQ